jgi:hypothetical protein
MDTLLWFLILLLLVSLASSLFDVVLGLAGSVVIGLVLLCVLVLQGNLGMPPPYDPLDASFWSSLLSGAQRVFTVEHVRGQLSEAWATADHWMDALSERW